MLGTAVDVYAFAIVLYECLELKPAWYESQYLKFSHLVFDAVLAGVRPTLSAKAKATAPSGFKEMLGQCWDEDPLKRPPFSNLQPMLHDMIVTLHKSRRKASTSTTPAFY